MGRVALILMVKNESKILERCLKSVEGLVDAYCITDTGSADTTCDIAKEFLKTHEGCLTTCDWTDFGTNRTISVTSAQKYLGEVLGWDLKETYGLLLDADMVFEAGTLKDQTLGEVGYTIVQKAGTLVYPNCRLIRLDYPWTCKGVTHEYWDGPTKPLGQEICWIDDRNDGGCKADKFERDARLLEKGLEDEPENVRYMFYLAQTYHSLNRWKDSIAMYKKRIQGGGWYEEVWYSHYMIGQCYLSLDDPIRFEAWMLRAYAKNPARAEPLYKLTKYFREHSQHHKAYHYLQLGKAIPLSTESLFVETNVYTELFHYEQSILEFYVHPETPAGLRASVEYGLRGREFLPSVLANLSFYAKPLRGAHVRMTLPDVFGPEYRPSAISIRTYPYANVRYVNYWIENGDYKTLPGKCVQTQNAYINLRSGELIKTMSDASVGLPRREVAVKGLEDIRLYGKDRFQATVQEYAPGVRVLDGRYNSDTGRYEDCTVLESPHGRHCEKNWLPVGDTGNILYDWHPLQVLGPNAVTHPTPPLFSLFRGSAPPVLNGGLWWTLVHLVEYSKPRKYYHCLVTLDSSFKPVQVSLPFVFRTGGIEYCVCMQVYPGAIEFYVSFQDSDPTRITVDINAITMISI